MIVHAVDGGTLPSTVQGTSIFRTKPLFHYLIFDLIFCSLSVNNILDEVCNCNFGLFACVCTAKSER